MLRISSEAATNKDTEIESLMKEWTIQAAEEAEQDRPKPIQTRL